MPDSLRSQIVKILGDAAFWEDGQNVEGTADKIMAVVRPADCPDQ